MFSTISKFAIPVETTAFTPVISAILFKTKKLFTSPDPIFTNGTPKFKDLWRIGWTTQKCL